MLYFIRLDSLRFIAFLLVFWAHNFAPCFEVWKETSWHIFLTPFFDTGTNGVHIFFVISGFLITFLLIKEHKVSGRINIRNFYLRRVLRIWPLYYLIMVIGIFVLPNITSIFEFCGSYWMNLSFLNNLNAYESRNCFSTNIVIAWSVAIEEQFYLFWPIVFFILKKKKHLIIFCILVLITSIIYTGVMYDYFSTVGNLVYLMVGCLGAIFYSKYQVKFDITFLKSKLWLWLMIGFLCITMLLINSLVLKAIITPLFYLYFVLYAIINNSGKITLFSKLGRYTYGMYFYHPIISVFVRILFDKLGISYLDNGINYAMSSIIALGSTIVVSIFSYTYFEGYFLNLKSKLSIVKTRI